MDWDSAYIGGLVTAGLTEDVGPGDVAVAATLSLTAGSSAHIVTDEELVCAGLPLVERIFRRLDPGVSVELRQGDGRRVSKGATLADLSGSAGAIFTGEQTVRNFLTRLCGIATRTRQFVDRVSGTSARISDSRNTAPGLRQLEQHAAKMGGAAHRYTGLFDAIVLRKVHVAAAGGIKAALDQAHSHASRLMNPLPLTAYEATGAVPSDSDAHSLPIQIVIENEAQLQEALSAGAEAILFEDLPVERVGPLTQLAHSRRPQCTVEISGDIPLERVRAYAESGVDYISPAGLTAAAPAVAIRLLVDRLQ
jgi:nicotinate-nucleotide pyrophosphorylase (carboxylating)